jgi:hypothetical protein
VNILLPPREVFKDCSPATQRRYNTLLMLVAYYGSLNVRQLSVQLYSSVTNNRNPVQTSLATAADATATAGDAIAHAQSSESDKK